MIDRIPKHRTGMIANVNVVTGKLDARETLSRLPAKPGEKEASDDRTFEAEELAEDADVEAEEVEA